jgi:hypothetical protein
MAEQDTEAPTTETSPGRAEEVADASPREDDRNDEAGGSPVPDPTEDDTTAEDVPDAD